MDDATSEVLMRELADNKRLRQQIGLQSSVIDRVIRCTRVKTATESDWPRFAGQGDAVLPSELARWIMAMDEWLGTHEPKPTPKGDKPKAETEQRNGAAERHSRELAPL